MDNKITARAAGISVHRMVPEVVVVASHTPTSGNDHYKNIHHHHNNNNNNNNQQLPHKDTTINAQYPPPTSLMNWKRKRSKVNKMCCNRHQNLLENGSGNHHHHHQNYLHLNSLWSIWYGIILTLFQGYLALHGTYRFLSCSLISWKSEPVTELNVQILLSGVVFILLPLFFITAVFKIGNFANDGVKLTTGVYWCDCSLQNGSHLSSSGGGTSSNNGFLRTLAIHGGSTSSFIHIVIALCLLLPRLLLEARIIENGLLPLENIWQSELDFLKIYRQRLPSITITNLETYHNNNNNSSRLDLSFDEDEYFYNTTMFTDLTVDDSSFGAVWRKQDTRNASSEQGYSTPPSEKDGIWKADSTTTITVEQPGTSSTSSQEEFNTLDIELNLSSAAPNLNITLPIDINRILIEENTTPKPFSSPSPSPTPSPTLTLVTLMEEAKQTLPGEDVVSSTTEIPPPRNTSDVRSEGAILLFNESNTIVSKPLPTTIHENGQILLARNKIHSHGKLLRKKHKGYKNRHRHQKQHQQQLPVHGNSSDDGNLIFEYDGAGGLKTVTVKTQLLHPANNGQGSKDSNIHIVRTERLPEIIPSTPITSDSKIIAIKTKLLKRLRRELITRIVDMFKEMKGNAESSRVAANESQESSTNRPDEKEPGGNILAGFAGYLQLLFGIDRALDVEEVFQHTPSAEFINLLIALVVWCVRYPSVFWITSKSFAIVFSLQITASALDILFSYAGLSILYKFQMYSQFQFVTTPQLLLNKSALLLLFLTTMLLNLGSAMILYLHGYVRLSAKMRERAIISLKSGDIWIYLAHILSCCYILILAIVKAPILNDLSAIYHQRPDGLVFITALIGVLYLLLWITIWLCLSVKRDWRFKLTSMNVYNVLQEKGSSQQQRPLSSHNRAINSVPIESAEGRFQVATNNNSDNIYTNSKLNNVERHVDVEEGGEVKRGGGNDLGLSSNRSKDINLRKQARKYEVSNATTDSGRQQIPNFSGKRDENNSSLLKVTFKGIQYISNSELSRRSAEQLMDCSVSHHHNNNISSKRSSVYSATNFLMSSGQDQSDSNDDGEYATLRSGQYTLSNISVKSFKKDQELITSNGDLRTFHLNSSSRHRNASASLTSQEISTVMMDTHNGFQRPDTAAAATIEDNVSEEGKLLAYVRDESITYAAANEVEPPLPPPPTPPPPVVTFANSLEDAESLHLVVTQSEEIPEIITGNGYSTLNPVTVTVHTYDAHMNFNASARYFRRNEVNVPPPELLTPRSETTSMGTSSTTSPPDRPSSESSSGVHSSEERENEVAAIRPRTFTKPICKLQQPAIQEEPYDRCTSMPMSSFITNSLATSSSTLPLQRSFMERQTDYSQHCSTMPLP